MMRVCAAMLACALLVPSASMAIAPDAEDAVLVAYKVDASGFNDADGEASAFWSDIGDGTSNADYALMTIENAGWQRGPVPWSGPDDAEMVVKAAYDANGLYFYFEANDNSWVEAEGFQTDGAELFLDNQSSADIYGKDPFEVFCYPTWWQMTYTCIQMQVNYGAATKPTTCRFNFYDETMWEMTYNTVTFDELKTDRDGITLEILEISGSKKAQEWFIPWSQVGIGGTGGEPDAGTRLAFTVGYNDVDGDNPGAENWNCLRWVNKGDPFFNPDEPNTWGDLQLGEEGGVASPVVHRATAAPSGAEVVRTEYYTALGQRITAVEARRIAKSGLVISRKILADGSRRTEMLGRRR